MRKLLQNCNMADINQITCSETAYCIFLRTKPSDIHIIWEKTVIPRCPNMQRNDWMIENMLFLQYWSNHIFCVKFIYEIELIL